MAKSIVTYCDVCLEEDESYIEGRTIDDILIGRQKPKSVDLCERHEKQIVVPFLELMQRFGVGVNGRGPIPAPSSPSPVKPAATAVAVSDDTEACLVCGEVMKSASASYHYGSKHPDVSRARLMKDRGLVGAIYECDVKDCGEAFLTMQGVRMHKLRGHGIKHADQ